MCCIGRIFSKMNFESLEYQFEILKEEGEEGAKISRIYREQANMWNQESFRRVCMFIEQSKQYNEEAKLAISKKYGPDLVAKAFSSAEESVEHVWLASTTNKNFLYGFEIYWTNPIETVEISPDFKQLKRAKLTPGWTKRPHFTRPDWNIIGNVTNKLLGQYHFTLGKLEWTPREEKEKMEELESEWKFQNLEANPELPKSIITSVDICIKKAQLYEEDAERTIAFYSNQLKGFAEENPNYRARVEKVLQNIKEIETLQYLQPKSACKVEISFPSNSTKSIVRSSILGAKE